MPKKLLINSPIAEAKTPAAIKADQEKEIDEKKMAKNPKS